MSFDDPASISGISRLVNTDNTKKGLNLAELEQDMLKDVKIAKQSSKDEPTNTYDKQLDSLAKELGISFDEDRPSSKADSKSDSDASDDDEDDSDEDDDEDDSDDDEDDSDDNDDIGESDNERSSPLSLSGGGSGLGLVQKNSKPMMFGGSKAFINNQSDDLRYFTEEQKKQDHINNVMNKINGEFSQYNASTFTIEDERRRDWRTNAVAEIEDLMQILEAEGEDLSRVPGINESSPDELVISVRNTLRYKNNRKQDSALFELVATSLAHGVEDVFNGDRELFGCKPDLTDWHHSVVRKLRRRRYETAEFVSGVMREYNISNGFRLGMELLLDAFLHHKSRVSMKENRMGKLMSSVNAADAMNEIAEHE